MIAIIDYGVGNLFSLSSSVRAVGGEAVVTGDPDVLAKADKLILPGVGAFEDAARKLREHGLADAVVAEAGKGKPLLGICLGMQMLFEESHEYGVHKGLGLIKGSVMPLEGVVSEELKIPHIGWNSLKLKNDCPIFRDVKDGDYVYFVHSYYGVTEEKYVTAVTDYGAPITAAVRDGNVYGCQFHPEKSGRTGLSILRAYCELPPEQD